MKRFGLLSMVVAFFLLTGTINAQNICISDVSHTADASAVLDVYSASKGMLVPRMSTAPTSPATGLFYFDNSSNVFKYYNGSSWSALSTGQLWSRTGTDTYLSNTGDNVVIGTNTSSSFKFYVYGATSQQSRFDGQVEFWDVSGGTMSADINSTAGNGSFSVYNAAAAAKVRFNSLGSSYITGGALGIGTTGPASLLHVCDAGGVGNPQLTLENPSGAGFASQTYLGMPGMNNYSEGLVLADNTYILNNSQFLAAGAQSDGGTMMKAYPSGIIDFNNQSRVRVWLSAPQFIPTNTWQPIDFDAMNYDEQNEWVFGGGSPPGGPPMSFFTAKEEGYYQVNSRTEYFLGDEGSNTNVMMDAYVSIAIYKGDVNNNWSMYAQGNNLQIGQIWNPSGPMEEGLSFKHNNAPNVSDVVYLQKGESIAIYTWQSSGMPLNLVPGSAKTYCSIHKSS